jgi:flagellar hook-associated protein 1 FlgK
MTLSAGLSTALSGLSTASDQISVLSRNVSRSGEAGASRKIANLVTQSGGGVRIASITRAANAALLEKLLGATSDAGAQRAIAAALDQLGQTVGDTQDDASPAGLLGKLGTALQSYAAAPQDPAAARAAVSAAKDLAKGLNDATNAVQGVRAQADQDMAASVASINDLLGQFDTVNKAITLGTLRGSDVTDELDQRDQILASLSKEIGIRTVAGSGGSMAIYTDSGVTLYDGTPRSVTFKPTQIFSASTIGNAVYADGVPITGNAGTMLASSGKLVGLASIRDNIAVGYQSQLDEIARGLVEAFSESDQRATPTLPDAPGLFTWSGAPAMPPSGTVVAGLAGTIRISASADPEQGGNAQLLRDGGIAGSTGYVYNATNASAYTGRLQQLIGALTQQRAFDPAAQAGSSATLMSYATASVAWVSQLRQSASSDADYRDTLMQRSSDALNKDTGISLDDEMTNMLALERSYQASARLVTTIDNMLQSLLQVVGR